MSTATCWPRSPADDFSATTARRWRLAVIDWLWPVAAIWQCRLLSTAWYAAATVARSATTGWTTVVVDNVTAVSRVAALGVNQPPRVSIAEVTRTNQVGAAARWTPRCHGGHLPVGLVDRGQRHGRRYDRIQRRTIRCITRTA